MVEEKIGRVPLIPITCEFLERPVGWSIDQPVRFAEYVRVHHPQQATELHLSPATEDERKKVKKFSELTDEELAKMTVASLETMDSHTQVAIPGAKLNRDQLTNHISQGSEVGQRLVSAARNQT